MTELAVRSNDLEQHRPAGAMVLRADQSDWTEEQYAALDHLGISDAPRGDQAVFRHVAQRTGLDPFARQIYLIGRNEKTDSGEYRKKWTIQTAIDGFRLIAERHLQFAGTLDPEWCGTDGVWRESWVDRKPPVMARVKVLRHDRPHPIALPVRFDEFAATFRNGDLMGQWKTKPAHMIAKVAEAAALRKAFPQDFSGLYTDDEMARENSEQGRERRVYDHSGAVTAAELTGQAPAPARDWDAEITAYEQAGNLAALRELWKPTAGLQEVRERLTAAMQRVKDAEAAGEVHDAEVVDEPDPRDEEPAQPAEDDAATQEQFWGQQGAEQ